MQKEIVDPSVPYVGPIYGDRFSPGNTVRIQGISPAISYRFNINLQCGAETVPRDDVALQVAVRFLDGYVSLNSLQNGIWEDEQRGVSLPINRAEKFEIILICDFNQYKVAINGQHYCEFPQRFNCDRITHLAIDGDVSIIRITYDSLLPACSDLSSSSGIFAISGAAPLASAPISVAPMENALDFEIVNATHTNQPAPGMRYAPDVQCNEPPSYEAATRGSPYPAGDIPYPTGDAPYPKSQPPYPLGGPLHPTAGPPYPTGVPGFVGTSPYPPPGAPGIPPPPLGAPVPLNAASSNFRRVKRSGSQRCCLISLGFFIFFILILIAVLLRLRYGPRRTYKH